MPRLRDKPRAAAYFGVIEEPLIADAGTTPWEDPLRRLAEGGTYWLATVRADGRPHVMPVLAVVVDGALHFSTGAATRKGKNLAASPHCVVALGAPGLDLVVEGTASKLTDERRLARVAEAYDGKYGWRVTVRDGALHDAEGAPTAGPPPYDVYAVAARTAYGFGTDGTFAPTRWRFGS